MRRQRSMGGLSEPGSPPATRRFWQAPQSLLDVLYFTAHRNTHCICARATEDPGNVDTVAG